MKGWHLTLVVKSLQAQLNAQTAPRTQASSKILAQALPPCPGFYPCLLETDEEGGLESRGSRGREREICLHTTGAIRVHSKNFSFYYSVPSSHFFTAPDL